LRYHQIMPPSCKGAAAALATWLSSVNETELYLRTPAESTQGIVWENKVTGLYRKDKHRKKAIRGLHRICSVLGNITKKSMPVTAR
jgi:hypothetical protein